MMPFDHARLKLDFDTVCRRVIRYASSDPGRELLQSLPVFSSVDSIVGELSKVTEFKRLLEEEGEFPLEGIHQVRSELHMSGVEGTVLPPRALVNIASTLRAARTVRAFLGKRRDRYPLLWPVVEPLFVDKVLEFNIDQAIDESGALCADASKELRSIRRSIADKYEQLRRRLESILKSVSDLGFSQDEIITTREGRMVIPVKTEHKHRVHGFIHSASASGATVFIEPTETLDLNNEIRNLHFDEQREVERILKSLTAQVACERDALLANLTVLARVDALHAKAKYSIEVLGVQPSVSENGPIKLVQARHPILILNHGYGQTVPLDIELGDGFNTIIISGPNAGGKSVALKCVGLLVLMTQAGLHIPASSESVVRVFRKVFVDIGDEQSIENDLSTFSSHLMNLKTIIGEADRDSLVLIDEVGSGTDPAEGSAIAASVLTSLTERGTLTIATTHHGALKVFAHETPGIENGAMEFDRTTLTPTYRFRSGVPGSSYALEMASRLGFSDSMLNRSREFLGTEQTKLNDLIGELETSIMRYRKDLESAAEMKTQLTGMIRQYESRNAGQAKELKEMKRRAIEEARQILDSANSAIERCIREIRESRADKGAIKHARGEVERLKGEIQNLRAETVKPGTAVSEPLVAGSIVTLAGGVEEGEVISIASDRNTAVVAFGSIRMNVPIPDLVPVQGRPGNIYRSGAPHMERRESLRQDLDVRGMTGEEALPLVDKFLDDAILAGLHRVDIIHGKGTGALKKKVAQFLSTHPRVKSFRLGEWNEGGAGATIVELTDS